jgi:hypothetical protein
MARTKFSTAMIGAATGWVMLLVKRTLYTIFGLCILAAAFGTLCIYALIKALS